MELPELSNVVQQDLKHVLPLAGPWPIGSQEGPFLCHQCVHRGADAEEFGRALWVPWRHRPEKSGEKPPKPSKTSERGGNTMEIRGYVNENQGISEEWSGHIEINPLKHFFLLSQFPCFSDQNMLHPMCPPWYHHFSSLNQVSGLNQNKTNFSSWKHHCFW